MLGFCLCIVAKTWKEHAHFMRSIGSFGELDQIASFDAYHPNNHSNSAGRQTQVQISSHGVNTTTHDENFRGQSPASPATTSPAQSSRYAYAYVVGGVDPETPNYRFYLYDIAVSTFRLRQEGSTADVVILIQMSFQSNYTRLPEQDVRLLDQLHVKVRYIPKAEDESFYRTMLDKFRILTLTQYDRVLFLDADIVLFGSLDYLFELSVGGVLKENVVIAGHSEPANGGFFMLAPKTDSHQRIMGIIRDKEARGALLPYPHFDTKLGWGHEFLNDTWKLINGKKSQLWDFHGGFADQGLLYYWVKYVEKSVSVVERQTVFNWGENITTNDVFLESRIDLVDIENRAQPRTCWNVMRGKACLPPHRDYFHFTGKKKPWLKGTSRLYCPSPCVSQLDCLIF